MENTKTIKSSSTLHLHGVTQILCFVYSFLFFAFSTTAQENEFVIQNWNSSNGLPQNTCHEIDQDSKGNIWVATFNGIAKFNGSNFKIYSSNTDDNIKSNRFTYIKIDKNDVIYALSTEGTMIYGREGLFKTITYPEPNLYPFGIHFDKSDTPIFLLNNHIYKLDNDSLIEYVNLARPGIYTHFISSALDTKNLTLYVARSNGLTISSKAGYHDWEFYKKKPVNGVKIIGDSIFVHTDSSSDVWYKDSLILQVKHRIEEYSVGHFSEGNHGEVWSTSINGIRVLYPDKTYKEYKYFEGLKSYNFKSVFVDKEGNSWIGTQDNGLIKLTPKLFNVISIDDGLAVSGVNCIKNDGDSIWIGNSCGGVNIYDKKSKKIIDHIIFDHERFGNDKGFKGECINTIYKDYNGHIWIGSYGDGIHKLYGGKTIKSYKIDSTDLISNTVIGIVNIDEDNMLIGTIDGSQILNLKKDSFYIPDFIKPLQNHRITQIFRDSDSTIWIGTYTGVFTLKGDQLNYITDSTTNISESNCRSFYEDEEGAIWIGTYGNGLMRYKNGKVQQITTTHGLYDNVISTIIRDQDRLWMSCNNGLYAVSITELRSYFNHGLNRVNSIQFGLNAGLKKDEFNGGGQDNGFMDHDGKLYLPSIDGLVIFDPFKIPDVPSPKIFVSEINIDGKSYDPITNLNIKQDDKRLTFEVSCPSFSFPQNISKKYRLIGFDTNWYDLKESGIIEYTQLPPGNYNLELKALSLLDKNDQPNSYTLSFDVEWPWYKKPTYIVILSLAIIGILVIVFFSINIQNGIRNRRFETELKRRTKQLSEREAQLKTIVENTDQLIFSLDKKLRLITFNKPFEVFVNSLFKFNVVVGQPIFINAKEKTLQFWNPKIDRVFKGEIVHSQVEGYLNDEFIVMQTTIYPIFDQHSKITGCVGFSKNITELIKREAELREAKNQAELAAQSKADFLATMSHEIRTPLNGVIGMTSLLMNEDLSEKQLDHLNVIRLSSETLMNIINEILDFSKIESGKIEIEKTIFSLKDAIDETVLLIKPNADSKGVKVNVLPNESIPKFVKGDVTRIRQVLINLLNNAVKFTEIGEITIQLKLISVTNDQSKIEFIVSDTGIGIKEEKLSDLFQPFKQLDSSTTRKYGGTGLGLVICKRFIEMMGGEIWVDSTYGEGTTFHFTIDFDTIDENTAIIEQKVNVQPTKSIDKLTSVLVAEDNLINQKLITMILSKIGITPDIASNGLEAIQMLKHRNYDLIFMDIQMPELDGIETTKIIRNEFDKDLQPIIVAMTANALEGDRERCLEAGMDDYITKPITLQIVKDCIEKWIN